MTTTIPTTNSIKLPSLKELTDSVNIGSFPLPSPLNTNKNLVISPQNMGSETPMYTTATANYTSCNSNSVASQNATSPTWNSQPLPHFPSVSYNTNLQPQQPQQFAHYYSPSPLQQPHIHQQVSLPPSQAPQQQQLLYYYFPPSTQPNPLHNPQFYTLPEVVTKPVHRCHRCGTTETPEWRRGPKGARTLCNACGLVHTKLVKKKGAALAAEEVLNNKVWRGKNGRRISIKKYFMNESQKNAKLKANEAYKKSLTPSLVLDNVPSQSVPMMVGNISMEQQRIALPAPHSLPKTQYYPC